MIVTRSGTAWRLGIVVGIEPPLAALERTVTLFLQQADSVGRVSEVHLEADEAEHLATALRRAARSARAGQLVD